MAITAMALGYNSLWSAVCVMVARSLTCWINNWESTVPFSAQSDFSFTPASHSSIVFAKTSKFSLLPFFSALSSSSASGKLGKTVIFRIRAQSPAGHFDSTYLSLLLNQTLLYRKSTHLRRCNVWETKVMVQHSTQLNSVQGMPPSTTHSNADWTWRVRIHRPESGSQAVVHLSWIVQWLKKRIKCVESRKNTNQAISWHHLKRAHIPMSNMSSQRAPIVPNYQSISLPDSPFVFVRNNCFRTTNQS